VGTCKWQGVPERVGWEVRTSS